MHSFEITTESRKRPRTGQYTEDVDNEIKFSDHSLSNDKCKATKNTYTTVLDKLPTEIIKFNQYIKYDLHHEDSTYSTHVTLTKNGCFRVGHWRSSNYIGTFANRDVAILAAILAFDNLFNILTINSDPGKVFDMLKDLAKGNEKRRFYKRLYNVEDESLQDFSKAWEIFNSWPNKPDGRDALRKFIKMWEGSELEFDATKYSVPPNILRTTAGLVGPRSKNFVFNMLNIKPIKPIE